MSLFILLVLLFWATYRYMYKMKYEIKFYIDLEVAIGGLKSPNSKETLSNFTSVISVAPNSHATNS